ncbi:NAD(P)-dependent oxidoreductase [Pedobacter cryophilus]|uniref:NAD(P)-dependent oxidoreductase n=1 Tax=Pedobacter cryophilus TaxID=2571271 RepID=A0A4U1BWK7_9SPHI|nr:NAD(P)-dependent oxidoreductase [Pedobacter cryophilus]TKB95259.1 NAD(P)-dependent oxidoreductase [Pedobacter cryophilus]
MLKIAFIGLGNMGIGMAQNLLNANYSLNVYNRTKDKSSTLKGDVKVFDQPDKAVDGQDIVITMLSDDETLNQLANGEHGFLASMKNGAIHISMSTISPDTSRELYNMHKIAGSHYLTAPVFGRPNAAAEAKLFICTSGDVETKEKAKAVLELLGQGIYDFGTEPGAANVVKLAGNFMIMASMETMAEAFTLAEKQGLDREQVAEFFGNTVFNAPIYKNYGTLIAKKQYQPVGFKSKLGFKDARLASKMALDAQMPAPLLSLVYNRLLSAVANGNGENDWVEGIAGSVSTDAGV